MVTVSLKRNPTAVASPPTRTPTRAARTDTSGAVSGDGQDPQRDSSGPAGRVKTSSPAPDRSHSHYLLYLPPMSSAAGAILAHVRHKALSQPALRSRCTLASSEGSGHVAPSRSRRNR